MVNSKKWTKPTLKVLEAGSAENLPTGTANDGGTGATDKRKS
jgi:hypothetical protein